MSLRVFPGPCWGYDQRKTPSGEGARHFSGRGVADILYRRRLRDLLLIALACWAGAVVLALSFPPARLAEDWLADLRLKVMSAPQPVHERIVLVTIEEETLRRFPYRSPLDRGFLASVLSALAEADVAAVGVDILFDQATEAEKDERLRMLMRDYPVPLVVAVGDARAGLTEAQIAFQAAFLDGIAQGYAGLQKEYGGVVRRYSPGAGAGRPPRLAAALVRAMGRSLPPGPQALVYRPPTAEGGPPFAYFPADTVALFPKQVFAGKIVLIGASLPQDDRHFTPFARDLEGYGPAIPGVMIHAHALAQFLDGTRPPYAPLWLNLLLAALAVLAALGLVLLDAGVLIKAGLFVLGLLVYVGAAFVLHGAGGPVVAIVMPVLAAGMTAFGGELAERRRERQMKRRIRDAFSRYVPRDVVARISDNPAWMNIVNERREMAFIFTDIEGFTDLSERSNPERLVAALNAYLERMSRIVIQDYGGTVDKFIGDAVVAFFNAPSDSPDFTARALRCALAMAEAAREFMPGGARAEEGCAFGRTRIGVHAGTATVGNFGGRERFDYTAIGDVVNTAARLEGANKYFGTDIIVSAVIAETARCDDILCRPIGDVLLKGKEIPIRLYHPVLRAELEARKLAGDDYIRAFRALEEGDMRSLANLAGHYPDDPLVMFHHRRLQEDGGIAGVLIRLEGK